MQSTFRYYAAFPALSGKAETLAHPASFPAANSVWATCRHGKHSAVASVWSDDHDSGSSSRDSSGERPDSPSIKTRNKVRWMHRFYI